MKHFPSVQGTVKRGMNRGKTATYNAVITIDRQPITHTKRVASSEARALAASWDSYHGY